MKSNRRQGPFGMIFVVALAAIPACDARVKVEDLPSTRSIVVEVGKRLGRSRSPGELTEVARRADRILTLLTPSERDALARGALRFRVDRPTVVWVSTVARSAPYWLTDLGFEISDETIGFEDGVEILYRKTYPAGSIGLGVNGLDRTAVTPYSVFLQAKTGGWPIVERIGQGGPPSVRAGVGVSPHWDGSRPIRSLPTRLLDSCILSTDPAIRLEGVLASGRVWKTHQPSTAVPDQVVSSFGDDPATELSFTWRTDPSVKTSAVRLGRPNVLEPGRIIEGDARTVESDGLLNDPTILRHRVRASGLEPDTTYAYAVGDGSTEGWGPWNTVRTAPAKPRDFGFLYLGDAQCGLERWGELLRTARARRPDAAFLLLAGDLVDRGNERTNWDHFFLRATGVFENIPFLPAVGNHEYLDKGPMIYRGTFELPNNGPSEVDPGLVYHFEYSDAFVAVLDSTLGIYDSQLANAQGKWLDRALSATKATWKFVMFHHPVYASHPSRENPELGAAWGPVFDKHHVDLVLQGHDHAYLRTHPMRGGVAVASPSEGTVYVVSVSGEKFYDQDTRDYTAKAMINLATYQTIDIELRPKRLTYRSFDRAGREVDALVIEKAETTAELARSNRDE